jgi:hypothetical protein
VKGRLVLRSAAVSIAVAAVVDPSVQSARPVRADVAVLDGGDAELTARVAARLDDVVHVIRGPHAGAAATIVAGTALPEAARRLAVPGFAVVPASDAPVRLAAIRAPRRASVRAAVPIEVELTTSGDVGDVGVALEYAGVTLDRVVAGEGDGITRTAALSYLPLESGPAVLRVHARSADGRAATSADVVVEIEDRVWRVLFFDSRPSWSSTFIRKAIGQDGRFEVTTRVITSRDVSLDIGEAPGSLDRLEALRAFDVIVAGAPEVLTTGEVAALERFARRRGGTVVLPLEARASGPLERLWGTGRWDELTSPARLSVAPVRPGAAALAATELAWPALLPPSGVALATFDAGDGRAAPAPVVWQAPLGAGEVVVSGALDGWRFRTASTSGFDAFWRATLADAAARALRPVDITPAAALVRPGARTPVRVLLRDAALDPDAGAGAASRDVTASVAAVLVDVDAERRIRLWPEGPAGYLRGEFEAPLEPGVYGIVVSSGGDEGRASIVVADAVADEAPADRAWLAAWATSRGGAVFAESGLDDMVRAVERTVAGPWREETWHPMRSAWWLAPFVLALGVEWWWRRRHGLP